MLLATDLARVTMSLRPPLLLHLPEQLPHHVCLAEADGQGDGGLQGEGEVLPGAHLAPQGQAQVQALAPQLPHLATSLEFELRMRCG